MLTTRPATEPPLATRLPHDPARDLAGRGGDDELVAVVEQDRDTGRLDERPRALRDQLEHALELRLAADRAGDLRGRLECADRPLELGAALIGLAVQPRVLDRDRRP